jgi:hypothetical protein
MHALDALTARLNLQCNKSKADVLIAYTVTITAAAAVYMLIKLS